MYEPYGIRPVHLELGDGGAPFDTLASRRVILHDRRFSPNNANIRLNLDVTDTPVFFSFAVDKVLRAAVVTLHVLPVGDGPSDRIRDWMKGVGTLRELRIQLERNLPHAHKHFSRLVAPLERLPASKFIR